MVKQEVLKQEMPKLTKKPIKKVEIVEDIPTNESEAEVAKKRGYKIRAPMIIKAVSGGGTVEMSEQEQIKIK